MGLFRFKWFHRLVRRHTNPIPEQTAFTWKERLSIVYMLVGWNILGVVVYMCFTGRSDWAKYYGLKTEEEANKKPAIYFAELLGIKKARIMTVSGFQKKEEFDYFTERKNDSTEASVVE